MFVSPWVIEVYVYSALTTAAVLTAVPVVLALVGSFGRARPRPGWTGATPPDAVARDRVSGQPALAERRSSEAGTTGGRHPRVDTASDAGNVRTGQTF